MEIRMKRLVKAFLSLFAIVVFTSVVQPAFSIEPSKNALVCSCTAEECLKKGIALEERAWKYANDDPRHEPHLFAEALNNFLCGSSKGNPMASHRAAILGESGQAPLLPKEMVWKLAVHAAEGGVVNAQVFLADLYCDSDIFLHCKDVESASLWLEKAAIGGSGNAANILGLFYERGQRGAVNLNRARACYAIAAKRGISIAQYNFDEATNKLQGNIKPAVCY